MAVSLKIKKNSHKNKFEKITTFSGQSSDLPKKESGPNLAINQSVSPTGKVPDKAIQSQKPREPRDNSKKKRDDKKQKKMALSLNKEQRAARPGIPFNLNINFKHNYQINS